MRTRARLLDRSSGGSTRKITRSRARFIHPSTTAIPDITGNRKQRRDPWSRRDVNLARWAAATLRPPGRRRRCDAGRGPGVRWRREIARPGGRGGTWRRREAGGRGERGARLPVAARRPVRRDLGEGPPADVAAAG